MKQHWTSLDGLRGILAFLVVVLHFGVNSFLARNFGFPPMPLALAVDIFFLLSGFVLTHSLRHGAEVKTFVIKRLYRLMPVYWVTTAATLLVAPGLPPTLWPELIAATPLLGGAPVNFPAWSVCFELYLPVLAVLIPLRLPQSLVRPALAATLLGLAACDYYYASEGLAAHGLRAALGLAAGHWLYRARLAVTLPVDLAGSAVLLAIVGAGLWHPLALLVPPAACLAILAGTGAQGRLFTNPVAAWLGAVSYPLYLVHVPVLYALRAVLGPQADGSAVTKLAGIAAALVLAGLITTFVERPAMALAGARHRRSAAAGG